MSRLLVIGAGPAGVSAALYAVRAGIPVTMLWKDEGALGRSETIENYYGFPGGISGPELFHAGLEQARALGVEDVHTEVLGLRFEDGFRALTTAGEFEGDALVLATGASRKKPAIPGFSDFEQRGISYCAICDGRLYRGKPLAVLGTGSYALHEYEDLKPHASTLCILTDGQEPQIDFPADIRVCTQKITAIEGDTGITGVRFENGERLEIAGLFVALGTAGSEQLAIKLGAYTENGKIYTEKDGSTTVPGCFAAGDCTDGLLQVARAVFSGMQAGLAATGYLRGKNT